MSLSSFPNVSIGNPDLDSRFRGNDAVSPWFILFFFLAFAFYLHFSAPTVTTGDSGEFITAAETLSLPHAPSFPLYMLAGKIATTMIPWGNPGYRTNVFSAFCSAGTLVLLSIFLFEFFSKGRHPRESGDPGRQPVVGERFKTWVPAFAGTTISILFGLTASFWMNSLVTEVFPLNTLLAVSLLFILWRARGGSLKWSLLFFFILGLGVGNHQTLVFFAPCWLIEMWTRRAEWLHAKSASALAFAGLLGFSIYFVLPVRSMKEPPLNWGQPTTVHKFIRTITRADYGSLSLATGETPERTISNTGNQLLRFGEQINEEAPWPLLATGLLGIIWMWRTFRSPLILFLFSGPVFFLLSNLPITDQSIGIMGRFAIFPVLSLIIGLAFLVSLPCGAGEARWGINEKPIHTPPNLPSPLARGGILCLGGIGIIFLLSIFLFLTNVSEARAHRHTRLVWDYGNAMLRTLPPDSAFFLDGGDDAFYSLAMLHYAMDKRPDLRIHDRGGLIYKNIYGADFRTLTKEEKKRRRAEAESAFRGRHPVYYSTMDPNALPGTDLTPEGFLMRADSAAGAEISWPLIAIRSLYPLRPSDYRSRALGAFFPYSRGKILIERGEPERAWLFLERAKAIGRGVDWLETNLGFLYAKLGYNAIQINNLDQAAKIYQAWIDLDPDHFQPVGNLGVVREKQGRDEEARELYEKSISISDKAVDPVYNLAVWYWKRGDWTNVIAYLEETLRRDPSHEAARVYLKRARENRDQRG